MQVQDLALTREEVVFDVQSVHGFKVPTQNSARNQLGDGRSSRGGIFDGMQRIPADLQLFFVLLVPLRDTSVEVPAVVIKTWFTSECFDLRTGFFIDVREAHDHVGNLHACVVDVVLNIDFPSRVTQQAHERVPKYSIAQMADVRGLIGIDAGVLDQYFSGGNIGRRLLVGGQRSRHPGAVDADIQIARRRDLHSGDAVDGTDFVSDGFCNLQRRAAQWLGEGKQGYGKIAECDLRRLFDDHRGQRRARITA